MTTQRRLASSSICLGMFAALAAQSACSTSNGSSNPGNGGNTQGAPQGGTPAGTSGGAPGVSSGGTGTAQSGGNPGSTNGGAAAGTSGAPATGSGGKPAVTCTNTDKTTIPIDKTGWVARECNNFDIQGAWYCYDDGVTQAGCTKNTPPFVEGKGMCLSGATTGVAANYGAAIGFSLNDSGKTDTQPSVKSAYNATTHGIKGFAIGISGDTGGLPLRVGFTKVASPTGVSPFYEVPGAPATAPYQVMIADALVPKAWDVTNAGETADPTSLYDLQIQIPGDSKAASFNFCITSLKPITDTTTNPGGGTLATYGSAQCDAYAKINVPNYTIQNNAYGGNQHCIQAKTDNATKAGFLLTGIQASKPTGGAPGSYPSIIYGWHVDGKFYGSYTTAKTLGSITSIPTNIAFTVPGSGRYNVSYDNWINAAPTAGSSAGTLEQMIWLNYRDTTPIGQKVGTVSLAQTTWDVWYGTHDGFATVSYVRTNTTSMSFDIKDFMKDTVQRGYATDNSYLLGIQAGFEIWEGSGAGFSVDSFDVAVK